MLLWENPSRSAGLIVSRFLNAPSCCHVIFALPSTWKCDSNNVTDESIWLCALTGALKPGWPGGNISDCEEEHYRWVYGLSNITNVVQFRVKQTSRVKVDKLEISPVVWTQSSWPSMLCSYQNRGRCLCCDCETSVPTKKAALAHHS